MDSQAWIELLTTRGVDERIIELITEVARTRALEPPTTETKQLLLATQLDGYAAGRVHASVLSLFFDPERAHRIGDIHGLSTGQRSQATWIVSIPAAQLDDPERRDLASRLLGEALDRIEPLGAWDRGLPDAAKSQGDVCPIHFVQKSLTGVCPDCE